MAPVPDEETALLSNAKKGQKEPPHPSTNGSNNVENYRLTLSTKILLATTWLSCILFGLYTAIFYGKTVWHNAFPAWEVSNPGMYHEDCPASNWGMIVHWVGGAYMMILGPMQFIKPIRRHYIRVHRWMGRLWIVGALLATVGAMVYVILTRGGTDPGAASMAGLSFYSFVALLAIVQTYRHAAYTKDIEQHAKWAWRLASIMYSILMFRCVVAFLFTFAPGMGDAILGASSFYLFLVPHLAFVEIYWRYFRNKPSPNKWLTSLGAWIATAFLMLTTFMLLMAVWLPVVATNVSGYSQSE